MQAVTLMYHDVVEPGADDASGFAGRDAALYKLEREQFARHLRALAGNGERAVLLTFDDGGRSAYTHTADLLEEHGRTGHFFVATDYIGTKTFLSPAEIRELHRRGHVIGSHSCSHPLRMGRCSWRELLREWSESVDALAQILGEPVRVASVPGGEYRRTIAEAAAEAGITRLFTSEPTTHSLVVEGCVVLGRYTIKRGTGARRAAEIADGRRWPQAAQALHWNLRKMAKAVGGDYYLRLRKAILCHE